MAERDWVDTNKLRVGSAAASARHRACQRSIGKLVVRCYQKLTVHVVCRHYTMSGVYSYTYL